jgi:hypothetical protein
MMMARARPPRQGHFKEMRCKGRFVFDVSQSQIPGVDPGGIGRTEADHCLNARAAENGSTCASLSEQRSTFTTRKAN